MIEILLVVVIIIGVLNAILILSKKTSIDIQSPLKTLETAIRDELQSNRMETTSWWMPRFQETHYLL